MHKGKCNNRTAQKIAPNYTVILIYVIPTGKETLVRGIWPPTQKSVTFRFFLLQNTMFLFISVTKHSVEIILKVDDANNIELKHAMEETNYAGEKLERTMSPWSGHEWTTYSLTVYVLHL